MSEHTYKHINLEYLYEIADNEIDFVKEMISDYISKLPPQFDELCSISAGSDFKQTAFIAHKLKSSFQFMGANELVAYAQEIEKLSKESAAELIGLKIKAMTPIVEQVLQELNHKIASLG